MLAMSLISRIFDLRLTIMKEGIYLWGAGLNCGCSFYSRYYSCKSNFKRTSMIREEFIQYFARRDHKLIRSSPVVPYCDPTVTFVNAGMNQFKGVFLGTSTAPAPRVVNSQKCIRVGGKHNDLDVVGSDGYHLTFFEMLGSWSFGDYFKKEACQLAWMQLTEVFNIDPNRLYVTYFGGEENSGIAPDLETKEIWLEIGVPESRVLSFGAKDNLWEMGITGPCGPCTEIHYDFLGRHHAAERVNAGHPDLIELWNLVFIQFERHEDGSLTPLLNHSVDTGMGLERLASVLQGVTSAYETDVFQPLFSLIQKETGAPPYRGKFGSDDVNGLDTGYRILADHSRMTTVAIADGMLPDHNHRLRRVIRRALSVIRDVFSSKRSANELLYHLSSLVADSLEGAFPGITSRLDCIQAVLSHEESMLSKLHSESTNKWKKVIVAKPELASIDVKSSPGIMKVYEELEVLANKGVHKIEDEKAFMMYDTYGLTEDTIKKLASLLGLQFDEEGLGRKLKETRERSRRAANLSSVGHVVSPKIVAELRGLGIPSTEDRFKYHYRRDACGNYHFELVDAVVQAVVHNGGVLSSEEMNVQSTEDIGLVLDRTCFYHESGGQIADTGLIKPINGDDFKFVVKDVQMSSGYLIHWGYIIRSENDESVAGENPWLRTGDAVSLHIDEEQRISTMRNHTGIHLLGAAIRHHTPAVAQRSSLVTPTYFNYQFSVYGAQSLLPTSERDIAEVKNNTQLSYSKKFSWAEFFEYVEEEVRKVVRSESAPVRRRTITGIQLLEEMSGAHSRWEEIVTVPGEVYPENGVNLIEVTISPNCILDKPDFLQVAKWVNVAKRSDELQIWSREPCCGTHVLDATDIQDFCLVTVESAGSGSRIVKAVTGPSAIAAKSRGRDLMLQVQDLKRKMEDFFQSNQGSKSEYDDFSSHTVLTSLEKETKELLHKARVGKVSDDQSAVCDTISYVDRIKVIALLEELKNSLREYQRARSHHSVEQEMSQALKSLIGDTKFLVHCIHDGGSSTDKVLQKATKCCPPNIPVLVFAAIDGGNAVKARCVVPKEMAHEKFNAEIWMNPVMKIFNSSGSAPRGQDPRLIFYMRERKFPPNLSKEETMKKFDLAVEVAQEVARKALSKTGSNS